MARRGQNRVPSPHEALPSATSHPGREPGAQPAPTASASPRWLCATPGGSQGLPDLPGDLAQPQRPLRSGTSGAGLGPPPSLRPSKPFARPARRCPGHLEHVLSFLLLLNTRQGLLRGVERPLVPGVTHALRPWPPLGSGWAGPGSRKKVGEAGRGPSPASSICRERPPSRPANPRRLLGLPASGCCACYLGRP